MEEERAPIMAECARERHSYSSREESPPAEVPNSEDVEQETDHPPVVIRTKSGHRRTIIAEPLVVMAVFAFAAYNPLRQQYAYQFTAQKYNVSKHHGGGGCPISPITNFTNGTNNHSADNDNLVRVQQETSQWYIYMNLAHGIPAVFVVFLMGAVSDKWGRKPIMILPLLGFIGQTGFGLATVVFNLSLGFMVFGEICAGLTGGLGLLATSAFAYIVDITKRADRPLRITVIEGTLGLSSATAMLTLGYAITSIGFLMPAIVIFSMHWISLIYTIFLIPETRQPKTNASGRKSACPLDISFIKHMFAPICRIDKLFFGKMLVMIALLILLLSFQARQDVITLYVFNVPLCWNALTLGIFGGIGAFTSVIGSLVFIKVFKKKISPEVMAIIGLASSAIASYFNGFIVFNTFTMFLVPLIGIVAFMAVPMTKAILSSMTPKDEQGAMFAAIASVDTCTTLFGGVLMNALYSATVDTYPGFVFVLFGILSTISCVLVVIYWFKKNVSDKGYDKVNQKDPTADSEANHNEK